MFLTTKEKIAATKDMDSKALPLFAEQVKDFGEAGLASALYRMERTTKDANEAEAKVVAARNSISDIESALYELRHAAEMASALDKTMPVYPRPLNEHMTADELETLVDEAQDAIRRVYSALATGVVALGHINRLQHAAQTNVVLRAFQPTTQ